MPHRTLGQPGATTAALGLALLCLAALAAAGEKVEVDPAARFLGVWEGPANVYDDLQVMRTTTAHVVIRRAKDDDKYLTVQLTVFDDKLSRFTRCEPVNPGELRVRDEVLVDQLRIKVDGVLRSFNGKRLDEAQIRFFVETPQGDFRPYYAVTFAAQRLAERGAAPAVSPSPEPTPATTPAPAAGPATR
jgi:hypothetical protein